jgi:hypothetical protein
MSAVDGGGGQRVGERFATSSYRAAEVVDDHDWTLALTETLKLGFHQILSRKREGERFRSSQ